MCIVVNSISVELSQWLALPTLSSAQYLTMFSSTEAEDTPVSSHPPATLSLCSISHTLPLWTAIMVSKYIVDWCACNILFYCSVSLWCNDLSVLLLSLTVPCVVCCGFVVMCIVLWCCCSCVSVCSLLFSTASFMFREFVVWVGVRGVAFYVYFGRSFTRIYIGSIFVWPCVCCYFFVVC